MITSYKYLESNKVYNLDYELASYLLEHSMAREDRSITITEVKNGY